MGTSFRRRLGITVKMLKMLIIPILLYASDYWVILKLPKNHSIETLFMRFCKELLGVQRDYEHRVLLELREIPLSITATRNAIKNWVRICKDARCNQLVVSSYENYMSANLSRPTAIHDVNAILCYVHFLLGKTVSF